MNKARDWREKRVDTAKNLEDPKQLKYASERQRIRHQFVVKALDGRGSKLAEHWMWLYQPGVKLSNQLLAEMGVVLIEDTEHPRFNARFIRYSIVYRKHKGKKQVSVEKQAQIDISMAKNMGELKRQFEEGTLHPDQQYNMDESYFVIDLDNGGLQQPASPMSSLAETSKEVVLSMAEINTEAVLSLAENPMEAVSSLAEKPKEVVSSLAENAKET
ncbi:hypothetical protein PInf_006667 [Phytophthora infestans]|nr:hypothetical protein PInf_006667 [Phytophthora infestans]